jgi:uncharacterized protein (TIGR01777 family)
MHVLITGGTGLIGKALTHYLIEKGYTITILTRYIPTLNNQIPQVQYAQWNVLAQTIDVQAVAQADHIIHLAGAGVAEKRWTTKRKKEIVDSRVQSSALLAHTLQHHPHKVKTFISASAIGWYGVDSAEKIFIETDLPAKDFLGETCRQWEEALKPITALGIRTASVRTGIVLSNDGGVLAAFKKPLNMGVASILGNGKQVMSWIHITDLVRLFIFILEHQSLQGPFNAVAPKPVSNKIFITTLAKILRGKFYIPIHIPSCALKLLLGEMSIEVLKSTTVSCKKIHQQNFIFEFPTIEAAFHNLLG